MLVPMLEDCGPVCGGMIAGLLHTVMGPDHLCALATLSACQGTKAFWFGVQWSVGHFAGMAFAICVLTLLHLGIGEEQIHKYSSITDCFIGLLLVSFGVYFLSVIDRYLDMEGNPRSASCACHAATQQYFSTAEEGAPSKEDVDIALALEDAMDIHAKGQRSFGAVAMGLVQGVLCPGGLVGLLFLKTYQPWEMLFFSMAFFVACSVAMGTLAAAYGAATAKFATSGSGIGRSVYYGSCGLSICIGVLLCILALSGYGHHWWHSHGDHDHHHHALVQLDRLRNWHLFGHF